ncbi:MAG: hypothetical protein BRD48_03325 [Bacteroidetes bacterium QS_9_68_14]|nr:MAG: hypothetical protein BRD48_03325 [Bacteroidetes bacterium QS_9_68_14]
MNRLLLRCLLPALVAGALVAAGCGSGTAASSPQAQEIALDTRADSMAMRIYEAHGGPKVWRDVPALAFSFAVGQVAGGDTTRRKVARHWWRRTDGMYRVEWSASSDSAYTAVFDVDAFDLGAGSSEALPGQALLNGTRLDSAAERRALRRAGTRFANDTYWLLAPLKLFDDGVNRSVDPMPAPPDSGRPALHLNFDQVGITHEDRYWMVPDSASGRLGRWAFSLQGMSPQQRPGVFRWTGYETFATPAGSLALSTRKVNAGGSRVIYTDEVRIPATLPDSLFSIERVEDGE